MQITLYDKPKDFLAKCGAELEQSEAEHNLMLSLCMLTEQKLKKKEKADFRGCTLYDDDGFVIATVQTPPHNLVISKARHPDIEKLAETLFQNKFSFPGVVGPSDVIAVFSNQWTLLSGQEFSEYMDHIVYALTKVTPPRPVEGNLRPAAPGETSLIAEWLVAFAEALPRTEKITKEEALKKAGDMIKAGCVFVWAVKNKPVAMASTRNAHTVVRIGGVYTPTEERGKGYASAIVAALSQKQLDEGKKMCCLYANARNPVSNSIYRKIGYEFAGRSSLYILKN